MSNKYDKALKALQALKKSGRAPSSSNRGFIFDNKEMMLDLMDKGHKVLEIHAILHESGVHIKIPTLRAYLSEIKKQAGRK